MKRRVSTIVAAIGLGLFLVYSVAVTASPAQEDQFAFLPMIYSGTGDGSEPGPELSAGSDQFPVGLAIASPLDAADSGTSPTAGGQSTETFQTAYEADALEIAAVFTGDIAVSEVFTPSGFLLSAASANCYGPNLDYEDHPDEPSLPDGQLPSGDLGIWNEYENVPAGGQDACAAAQLTKRMFDISNQGKNALILSAGMYAVAVSNGITLPTSGGEITLTSEMNAASIPAITFYTATIAYDSGSNTWEYDATFEFDNIPRGITNTITTHLEHTPVVSGTGFSGKLSYLINDMRDAFNCSGGGPGPGPGPGSETEVTINGSLVYSKTSSTEMKLQSRTGTFCGHDNDGRVDGVIATSGWSDNFAIFTADYDPSTTAGNYAYAWQAGDFDAASRVLNTIISDTSPLSGEAYFGYGDRVQEDADGSILVEGLYCNWAGPSSGSGVGDASRFQNLAQRQSVEFNSSTGYYDSTDTDIYYAPTTSCLYDGSGSFWYDRNLNQIQDELATDIDVTTATLDLLQPVDLNLDLTATITEAIQSRGYALPTPP